MGDLAEQLDKQSNAILCLFQMMRSKRRTRNRKRRTKEEKDIPTFSEADDNPEKRDCDERMDSFGIRSDRLYNNYKLTSRALYRLLTVAL